MKNRAIGFQSEKLLAPAEALEAFFARATLTPPRIERVALDDAAGRVLATVVDADDDYPNAPRSAMDGFAVASASTPGTLPIAGDIAMGRAWSAVLRRGEAASIATGGVVPEGADAVVPIEDVRVDGNRIVVEAAVAPGENVSPRAGDMRRGERILEPGQWLAGPQIGVLATVGAVEVSVYRRPLIAMISSGDELVPPFARPRPGEIRDSNRYAIAASLRMMGATVRHYPTVSDEAGALEAALAEALADCDAIVVTGGSSVGERDRTPAAVASLGEPGVIVHGLRVKPGKPTVLAAAGGKPVIGLPGNPTSALMILEAVAAPVIAALTGAEVPRAFLTARLGAEARARAGWTWYVPAALQNDGGTPVAHPLPLRSSSVSLPARAGGYVVVEGQGAELPAGTLVTVFRFLGR
jgi:molybdenum cofactor synthesis domain-containing protein